MQLKFSRQLAVITLITGLGLVKVAQRNAVMLKGYALGERTQKTHEQQTQVSWLSTDVLRLSSPAHLSQAAEERHLNLVAWSTLSGEQLRLPADATRAPQQTPADAPDAGRAVLQVADSRDTSD